MQQAILNQQTGSRTNASGSNSDVEKRVVHSSNNTLAAIAPHGGNIESETDTQAFVCAKAAGSCSVWAYCASPSEGNAFDEYHRSSTEIEPNDYETLSVLAESNPEYAVSFHGWNPSGPHPDIYIGGRLSRDKRTDLARKLRINTPEECDIAVAEYDDRFAGYRGIASDNIVNQLPSRTGLQLEQTIQARQKWGKQIATVVGEFLSEDI